MIAFTYPLLDLFWSILVLFGLLVWVWVLIAAFTDIVRSRDIGGWAKAGWFLLVLALPLFGVLIYLVVRGRTMYERAARESGTPEVAFHQHARETTTSNGSSTDDELSKLTALAEKGAITRQEFREQRVKLLGK